MRRGRRQVVPNEAPLVVEFLQNRQFPYAVVQGLFAGAVLEMRSVGKYEKARIAIDVVSAISDNVDVDDVRQCDRQLPHNVIQGTRVVSRGVNVPDLLKRRTFAEEEPWLICRMKRFRPINNVEHLTSREPRPVNGTVAEAIRHS